MTALGVGALVLVVLAVGGWLGARWAFESPAFTARLAPRVLAAIPGLSAEGLTGTLASGLSADRVVYENDEVRVVLTSLRAEWSREAALGLVRGLLRRGEAPKPLVAVRSLSAQRVEITSKGSRDGPAVLPRSLELPVRVDVGSIRIGELVHANGPQQVSLRDIEGRVASDGARHSATLTSLVHASGSASGELAIGATSPFPLSGRVSARGQAEGLGIDVNANVSGTLESLQLEGRLAAAQGSAGGEGSFEVALSPFGALPVSSLTVSTRALDLSRWNAAWPRTQLDLDVQAAMTDSQELAGEVRVRNGDPGPIDAARVPLRALQGRFAVGTDRFALDGATATTTRGNTLRAEARIAGGQGQIALRTEGIAADEIDGRARPLRVRGAVSARLDGDVTHFTADLRHAGYALVGEATRKGSAIEVREARIDSPYGRAQVAGSMDLAGVRAFRVNGTLSGFNPADFGELPQARLNGRFAARGALSPQPSADVRVELADSTLRGKPLAGSVDARVSERRRFDGSFDLRLAGNRVMGKGAFGEPGDRLQFSIDAPVLADVDPRLRASVVGSGELQGTLEAPRAQFTAKGRLLGVDPSDFGDFPAARLHGSFSASGGLAPEFAADVELRLADSTLRGQPLSGSVDARVTARKRFEGVFDVRYAGNRATGKGTFGEPGDRLQWTVDAPSLARIDPRFRGSVAGSGVLHGTIEQPLAEFKVEGRLAGIDPADFGDFPAAHLAGSFSATGALDPEPSADVRLRLADSTLRGKPIAGTVEARVSREKRFVGAFDLAYAGNHATGRGAFGAPGDVLGWRLDAPALAAIDPRLRGGLAGSGELRGTLERPAVAFTATGRGLAFGGEAQASVASGEIDARGTVEVWPGGAFDLRSSARELAVGDTRVTSASVAVEGSLDAHRLSAEAVVGDWGKVSVRGSGGWQGGAQRWAGTLEHLVSERPAVALQQPTALAVSTRELTIGPTTVEAEGGRITLSRFAWRDSALSVGGSFDRLALARWLEVLKIDQKLSTTLVLAGTMDVQMGRDLRGRVEIARQSGDVVVGEGEQRIVAGLSALSATISAPGGGDIVATASARGERIGTFDATMRTRFAQKDGGWTIGGTSPLEGRLAGDLRNIRWANAFLPGDFRANGRMQLDLRAAGTVADPKLTGTVVGERLALRSLDLGVELTEGELRGSFEQGAFNLERFAAKGPTGTVSAKGRIVPAAGSGSGRIEVTMHELRAISRPDRTIIVSGTGGVEFSGSTVRVRGKLRADEGKIDLPPAEKPSLASDVVVRRSVGPATTRPAGGSVQRASAAPDTPRQAAGPGLAELDVEFDFGDRFTLRGRGIDTRLTGLLRLTTRKSGELDAHGTVQTVDGTYAAYGRRLEIERGVVTFSGPIDSPALDVRAMRTRQDVEAGVQVTGTLTAPRVQLISRPEVADAEKLSWLVLGQGLDKSNRAQAALLQSAALAVLSPSGGAGIQGQIADLFGFDQFSFSSGDSLESGVVSVGKRLTQDIYLSVEQGLAGTDSFVELSLMLGKKWTVTAKSGGQENALDVFYTLKFDSLSPFVGADATSRRTPPPKARTATPTPGRASSR